MSVPATRIGVVTYRQLDVWTRTGLVEARDDFRGPGNPRHYDDTEAAVVITAGRLVNAGVTPRTALTLARQLHEHGHADIAGYRLSTPDQTEGATP